MDCWNGNGSQKMGSIFRHFRRSRSRKVVIGDGMDRQDHDSDRWKSWLGAKNSAKVGKRSQKSWILESGIGTIFFNIVQSIHYIYTSLKEIESMNWFTFIKWNHRLLNRHLLHFVYNERFCNDCMFQRLASGVLCINHSRTRSQS